MKTLDLEQMENIEAGGFVEGLCVGLGIGGGVAWGIAAINAWNPVGWVVGAWAIAGTACAIYGAGQL